MEVFHLLLTIVTVMADDEKISLVLALCILLDAIGDASYATPGIREMFHLDLASRSAIIFSKFLAALKVLLEGYSI